MDHGVLGADAPMATRCKKWSERMRHASTRARVGRDVPVDTLAGLRSLALTFSFETVAAEEFFTHDQAYLCPGWFINDTGMCLIFTTFNFMLNIYRASCHPAGLGTVYALDHTYKVSMPIPWSLHSFIRSVRISTVPFVNSCGHFVLCLCSCCLGVKMPP